jgi:hypothetical protein
LLNEIPVALATAVRNFHVAPPSALKFTSKSVVLGYVLVHVTVGELEPVIPSVQVSPPFGLVIRTVPVTGVDDPVFDVDVLLDVEEAAIVKSALL